MTEKQQLGTKHARQAGLLSIVPGIGQIYNKQLSKGIIFLAILAVFIYFTVTFGIQAITGLITLGTEAGRDHSMFMMVEGALALIIYVIFLIGYIINIYDAVSVGRMRDRGIKTAKTFKEIISNVWENGFPYLLTMPAYILMAFVIIFPVLVTIFMAFTNYDLYHTPPANLIDWVGFKNFFSLFTQASWRETFFSILSWTFIWTICATVFSIVLGITVAIVSNQSFIKGKRFFRIIFLLPWAVPAFITILTFSNMFNDSIGAINTQVIPFFNTIFPFLELTSIPWKTDPTWTKVAVIMIQTWLGFPYIFVMVTGVLQSIPGDLYEAANMDGATGWQQFMKITLPMILFATAPVLITQFTFNFNNFSLIYLFNAGGPGNIGGGAGSTDILISWIYKLTTSGTPQYAVAAAVTLLISSFTILVAYLGFKRSNAFGNEDMM